MRFEVRGDRGPLVVGLTGGIGSGKSTVAERFRVLDVPVIDADEISRELVQPGQPALDRIVAEFGEGVLDGKGGLDRAKLRGLVFADAEKRKALEAILHPLIRAEMRRRTQNLRAPYCILAIPLLLETGQSDMVDRVLVVDAPPELQTKRAMARDKISAEEAQAVLDAQVDRATRLAAADDVIVNDKGLEDLYAQVDAVHQRYLQLSRNRAEDRRDQGNGDGVENQQRELVVYELPLNERIRTFLRLECLFQQVDHFAQGDSAWEGRAAVAALLDLLEVFSRFDLKKELLQEMERLAGALNRFLSRDDINRDRLEEVLEQLNALSHDLHGISGPVAQHLRQHELLLSVKQRVAASGGVCSFDLPVYHHWLSRSPSQRRQDLESWVRNLEPVRRAVDFVLELIRGATVPQGVQAKAGFFQQSLDAAQPYQLVRVKLPSDAGCYAEISGGRHRFSVRFMVPGGDNRAVQTDQDVNFELSCCAI